MFQRFAAFLAPLTFGRVNIAVNAIYISKVACFNILKMIICLYLVVIFIKLAIV